MLSRIQAYICSRSKRFRLRSFRVINQHFPIQPPKPYPPPPNPTSLLLIMQQQSSFPMSVDWQTDQQPPLETVPPFFDMTCVLNTNASADSIPEYSCTIAANHSCPQPYTSYTALNRNITLATLVINVINLSRRPCLRVIRWIWGYLWLALALLANLFSRTGFRAFPQYLKQSTVGYIYADTMPGNVAAESQVLYVYS
jgi:hypothetical protein